MKICAVVPTFNCVDVLRNCLGSLARQSWRLDGLIVVDNASTDPVESLARQSFRDVTYIHLETNKGSAGGYAAGMKHAYEKGYDWIWLMDNDAEAAPDALEKLLRPELMQGEIPRILCCAVHNSDDSVGSGHRVLFDARRLCKRGVGAPAYRQSNFRVDLASYTGQLVSRQVIDSIGFPREELFLHWDDFEYCLRLRARGGDIIVVPSSRVVHDGKLGTALDREYYSIRNRVYVCREHFGRSRAFWRLVTELTARRVGRIILCQDDKRKRLSVLFYALRDALRGRLGKYSYE